MVVHLLHGFHEDEGTVGGKTVFASFGDGPTFFLGVSDGAVIGGDGFEFDLDVSLH